MNRSIKNNLILGILVSALCTLAGCKKEYLYTDAPETVASHAEERASHAAPSYAHAGEIIFKVTPETMREVKLVDAGVIQMNAVPSQMADAFRQMSVSDVKRLIPPMGKYDWALQEAGLDRWFIAKFDDNVDLSMAFALMSNVEGVTSVEYSYDIKLHEAGTPPPSPMFDFNRSDEIPFNDPRLPEQWHYNNRGPLFKQWAKEGADINLFKAWKVTTGSPDVLVCIVDGGIDINHEDLRESLWTNPGEIPNNGKDDDNNGFIDDIHGFCFVNDTADIQPDNNGHGTHVAGTVAARNNNHIGVAGVAGGDGTKDSGIRIMNAAIFRSVGGTNKGGKPAAAIVYGAVNGAVISQNSWGYPFSSGQETLPENVREAIDFFIKNAGTVLAENDPRRGQQRADSRMKGGIMFFSAGNDNLDYPTPPALYEPVVAVAAIGPDFTKGSYSTYGNWVDISAPGGDMRRYGEPAGVLSTMAPSAMKGSKYHFYHGTSMACPHVSGVAALALSVFGGQGYTNEDLKKRILASVLPINLDEVNPKYAGKLGVGTIDAYAAVTSKNENKAPGSPIVNQERSTLNDYTSVTLYWTVPSDPDDGQPLRYRLYYSEEQLNSANYSTKGNIAGTANGFISGAGTVAGGEMNFKVPLLTPDTEYHFALVAYDRWGIPSAPAFFKGKTLENHPADITNLPKEPIVVLDSERTTEYVLRVNEPDGHTWSYEISGQRNGVTIKKNDKGIILTFRPVLAEGEHKFTLKLTDELRLAKSFEIPFRVVHVKEPVMNSPINSLIVGVNSDPVELALSDYYASQYYLKTEFKVESANTSVATTYMSNDGHLFIIGEKPGKTTVLVTASNGHKSSTTSIDVTVTPNTTSDVFSIWPVPVERDLNIWLNPKHKRAEVRLQSLNGELIMKEQVSADKSGIAKLNMRSVTPGSYVIVIETDGRQSAHSVLKR